VVATKTLLRFGLVGSVIVALCCLTPILVVLLAAIGLSALTGYLDAVLLPALTIFVALTIYAVWRQRKATRDACCEPTHQGIKE
jgi:L-lactate permease